MFICVTDKDSKEKLENLGFILIKANEDKSWVFVDAGRFDLDKLNIVYARTNVLAL